MIGKHVYGRINWFLVLLLVTLVSSVDTWSQTDLPDVPDIILVTVDHTDDGVLIQWEPSSDNDIEFYKLYRMNPDQSFTRIFEFSGSTFEYKHMTSGLKNLAYSVTALDSSGNESLFGQNVHRAVSTSIEFDPCTPSNIITWTPYEGWEGQISGYKVWRKPVGGSFQNLDFVLSSDSRFTDMNISINTSYLYYIECMNLNGTLSSLSPIDSISTHYPEAPSYLTVDYVTVLDDNTVELQFTADVSGLLNSFRVMKRRSNTDDPFAEVETLWNINQSTQVIQDQFPTSTISYEYLIESIYLPASCSTPIVISESNTSNNILLQHVLQDQMADLNWTPYVDYPSGLSGYIIQRKSDSGEFYDIQTVYPGISLWRESVTSLINGFQPGELQYRILAIGNENEHGHVGISISNIITLVVETNLQVPSAFTPGSNDMNSEFKPLIDFAPKEYVMIVMDRGGRKMFETTDPGEGWDGRFRGGEFVNEGVYVYYLQYTDYTGLYKSFTGNVTVLYP